MTYTIKQLADLAGVSVRTLHYYDEVGILRPSRVQKNGYRLYDQKDLVTLQQILFFKELDFPLEKIRELLASPTYNPIAIMQDQKLLIEKKKERLEKLITAITNTITTMKKNKKVEPKEMYGSFSKAEYKAYKQEASQRWGSSQVKRSEEIVKSWGKEKLAQIKAQGEAINHELAAVYGKPVESQEVQSVIEKHYNHIIQFYDKSWPLLKIYRGLADMYVQDERFAANYNRHHPDLANFMQKAMIYFCENQNAR